MTKKTDPEILIGILDTYCSGVTNSLGTVATMNGVSFKSVYTWLRDETLILDEYMGVENISFGKAMNMARNVSKALTISRSLEDRVLNGLKVQVWHHGEPSFVDDEQAILVEDLDLRETLFGYRDGKKRDADGNRIIATRVEAPPAQLVEVYARANMPSIYGNKNEVTMRGNLNLGVTVAGTRPPLPAEVLAQIAPKPVTETNLLTDTTDGEVYEADSLDDLLGPDPVLAPTTDTPPEAYDPEPVAALPRASWPTSSPMIASAPTERETSPPQPVNSILGPTPKTIPAGWRSEWEKLQARPGLPDKNNRRA